jgi:probable HAF family extracellular repeat protein
MKVYVTSWKGRITSLVGALFIVVTLVQSGLAQATYSITDLGTLGGTNSIPIWITNTGDVIGISDTGQFDSFGNPIDHAFRWSKGVLHDLGTKGDVDSVGLGGNELGAAVGSNYYNINHALVWYNGAVADLGTLVGPDGYSSAQQINNEGQIVGGSQAADGTGHAVLWNQGRISDLGTFGVPNTYSFANGINDLGEVVGGAQPTDVSSPILGFPPFHATLWNKGVIKDLGAGPEGSIGSAAFNINNKTQVVGRFALPDPVEGAVAHAFLWESGVMHDLGVPAGLGDDNNEANSLNDNSQIVGDSGVGFIETYNPDHALLWQNGAWSDLNTLILSNSGYYLIVAFDVNGRGQIVVCAVNVNTGNIHAALLSPQPSNVNDSGSSGGLPHKIAPTLSENARQLLMRARAIKLGFGKRDRSRALGS